MGYVFGTPLEKGGVGKTTSSANLAVEATWDGVERTWPLAKPKLKQAQKKSAEEIARVLKQVIEQEYELTARRINDIAPTLGVDADGQRNFTMALGVLDDTANGTAEILINSEYGIDYVVKQSCSGVYVVPSSKRMSNVEDDIKVDPQRRMLQALREAEGYSGYTVEIQAVDRYKSIWVDCPPNMGLITDNVIAASDYLLIPLQAHYFAFEALDKIDEALKRVRRINKRVEIGGVFLTMYENTGLSNTILQQAKKRYGTLVFDTIIPKNVDLGESPVFGLPIQLYNHLSAGAQAYRELYQEIKKRFSL